MSAFPVDPAVVLAADDARGVSVLLGELGFTPDWVPIPRETYPEFGLDPEDVSIEALHQVARSHGLTVLLLEVGDPSDRAQARRYAARLHHRNRGWPRLLVLTDAAYERLVFASWGVGGVGDGAFDDAPGLRLATVRRRDPGRAGLDLLAELAPGSAGSAVELVLRHAQALDKERITRGFYRAVRRARDALARAWTGPGTGARGDRLELALLTLSRLLFLAFLQQKGWLDGDRHYLRHLYERVAGGGDRFYEDALVPLFFSALNTPPGRRSPEARRLGVLPFLNGGLFERYPIERRQLDAPDEPFGDVILNVFERYRFTVQEDTPLDRDAAVDPEMLGRVFEGLMQPAARARSGTFYTPTSIVTRLVTAALAAYLERAAGLDPKAAARLAAHVDTRALDAADRARSLDALRRVRILDPAVGSGAFLLVALQKLEALLGALGGAEADRSATRRAIVHENLYGVDQNGAAVRLCELRLWLALVVDLEVPEIASVPPLPNLDHKIRQGDTLLDPLDLWAAWMAQRSDVTPLDLWAESRRGLRALEALKVRYLSAAGARKETVAHVLRTKERDWTRRTLARLESRATAEAREWTALRRGRDLFGRRVRLDASQRAALQRARRARRELRALARRLADADELPFFSWAIHFAEVHARGGFDIVLGNPPWVRPHHLSSQVRETLRERYGVARDAAWPSGVELSGAGRGFGSQVDLAAAFVERALEMLAPTGVLALLLPAKLAGALYAGGLRRLLLEKCTILLVDDHSQRPRLFQATTYPLALVCRKEAPPPAHRVEISVRRPARAGWRTRLPQRDLPLWPGDAAAPWCLAPAAARRVVARMLQAGPPLARAGFAPARGIVTGANSIFCLTEVHAERDSCVTIRAERASTDAGSDEAFAARVEADSVRPLLRGADLRAFRVAPSRWVLFPHDPRSGRPLKRLPAGVARYLALHEPALRRRRDLRPRDPYWTLFRVTPAKLGPCVAWRDLGRRLEAVALPGLPDGPVPLNTVYLIPAPDPAEAHALVALLNSTLVSRFLTTFAERAAGGFARYFAWTVGSLPLPGRWRPMDSRVARLAELGVAGHESHGLGPEAAAALEETVRELYGLDAADADALRRGFEREEGGRQAP